MKKEYLSPELELVRLNFGSIMEEPHQNVSNPEGYEHEDHEIDDI